MCSLRHDSGVPVPLLLASKLAWSTHPRSYIAFRRPLHVVDRREYQLYVHILHSAAALTGRVPVVPLAFCRCALFHHPLLSHAAIGLQSVAATSSEAHPCLRTQVCCRCPHSTEGEWSISSRCVFVLHASKPKDAKFCVMRLPSVCHGKVALPHVLEGLAEEDIAVAYLPRLQLLNGSVDVRHHDSYLSTISTLSFKSSPVVAQS